MKTQVLTTCIAVCCLLLSQNSIAQTRISFDVTSFDQGWATAIDSMLVETSERFESITASDSAQAELVVKITAVDLRAVKAFTVVVTRKEADHFIYLLDTMRIGSRTEEAIFATLEWLSRAALDG